MVWVGSFILVVSVAVTVGMFFTRKMFGNSITDTAKVGGGIAVAGCLLIALSSICFVDAGHVGVPVVNGSVRKNSLPEGLNFVNPFATVHQMSARTENFSMSTQSGEPVVVRCSGLQMPVDVSVPYKLSEKDACWIYQNLGDNYVDKLLKPALAKATRVAAAKYTAEELYSTKLEEFNQAIPALLATELEDILTHNYANPPKNAITFSQVLVGYIGIPETVRHAIENKLKADQEQQAMTFALLREKQEAERKKIEAQGIKEFQSIVSEGVNENLLRWKGLDATIQLAESPNTKVIIIGAGKDGLPVLLGNAGLAPGK